MNTDKDPALNDVDFAEGTDVVAQHASVHREKSVPQTGMEPVSLWFLLVCAVVLVIGAGYLGSTSGGFDMNAFNIHSGNSGAGYNPAPPFDGLPPAPPEEISGKKIFNAVCSSCHKTTGLGQAGQYPPLAGSSYVTENPIRLTMLVLNGLTGPIEVKGALYNGVMSAQKSALSDAKIAAVLTYIRSSWGNDAPPISEEFVAQIREKTASQGLPYTLDVLEAEAKALKAELGGGDGEATPAGTPAETPAETPAQPDN